MKNSVHFPLEIAMVKNGEKFIHVVQRAVVELSIVLFYKGIFDSNFTKAAKHFFKSIDSIKYLPNRVEVCLIFMWQFTERDQTHSWHEEIFTVQSPKRSFCIKLNYWFLTKNTWLKISMYKELLYSWNLCYWI